MTCVCVVVLVACSPNDEVDPLVADLKDLCRAVEDGARLDDQERAFFDRAHDAVHELARRVTESDPGIGGELLEAKERIESELVENLDNPIPEPSFERLIGAANDALEEIDLEAVSC